MSKMNHGWLVVAAALAVGASSAARAGGDNSMNPMYGDSYAVLEGNGHNVGTQGIAPEGAYAAHEMDGQMTSLMDQMHRTQATIADRTNAATERMRTAMNLQNSTSSEPPATTAAPASATTAAPATTASPASTTDLTGSTSAPSAAGPVIAAPGSNTTSVPESSSQPGMNNGYRISNVNPRGQAPTIVGPGS